uniref:Uncharacterized protein n=1 Tax=Peronospora matthiolae TaxID=2874970 RepID=A0AAV1VI29_9STRA
MVFKSLRVAAAAARKAAARMRAAGDSSSQASAVVESSPVVVNSPRRESTHATITPAVSAEGGANCQADESETEIIFSGESDDASDSKATPHASGKSGAETSRARLTGFGKRDGIMLEIFGPSDCSDEASSHASPSNDRMRGDVGDSLKHYHERSDSKDRAATGVSAHADTNHEARDRDVLHHSSQVEFS